MSFTLINPPENKGEIDRIAYTTLAKAQGELSKSVEFYHGLQYVPLFITAIYESAPQTNNGITYYQDQFAHLPFLLNYSINGEIAYYVSGKADKEKVTLFIDVPANDPSNYININLTFGVIIVLLKEKMPSS